MTPEMPQQETGARRRPSPRAPSAKPTRPRGWQRIQDEMVERYADHAIEGGRRIAGEGADDEAAIDAYLDRLRDDLLKLTSRG